MLSCSTIAAPLHSAVTAGAVPVTGYPDHDGSVRPMHLGTDTLVAIIVFCFIAAGVLGILGYAFAYAGK
jgi:hypothetical protein